MSKKPKEIDFIQTGNSVLDKILSGGLSPKDVTRLSGFAGPSVTKTTYPYHSKDNGVK